MWWPWRHPCQAHNVVLNFKHDPLTAIEGVLWDSNGPWLRLRHASLLKGRDGSTGVEKQAIVGEVIVHRSDIAFYQL